MLNEKTNEKVDNNEIIDNKEKINEKFDDNEKITVNNESFKPKKKKKKLKKKSSKLIPFHTLRIKFFLTHTTRQNNTNNNKITNSAYN